MQVDGPARVQLPEYSRTSTCVENASVQHKYNMTVHAMSLNRQAESFMSWNLHEHFIQFTWKESTHTR